jgi:hypothetical protein
MSTLKIIPAAGLLLLGLGTAGCENPVTPGHHDDPVMVVVLDDDTEIARADLVGPVSGEIVVGVAAQSPLLAVVFVDEHGDPLEPHEHTLRVTPQDAAVATWIPTEPGGFEGRVQGGQAAGQTRFTFEWVHGAVDTGHSESTFSIPVTVSP